MDADKPLPDTKLVISRQIQAPRHDVFMAFSNAHALEQWLAPDDFTASCDVDFKKGGTLRIVMRGQDQLDRVQGVYKEIVPDERIVMSLRFDGAPEHEVLQTVKLSEEDGRTTVTVEQQMPSWDRLRPAEQRVLMPKAEGSEAGWRQSLRHLDKFVTREA